MQSQKHYEDSPEWTKEDHGVLTIYHQLYGNGKIVIIGFDNTRKSKKPCIYNLCKDMEQVAFVVNRKKAYIEKRQKAKEERKQTKKQEKSKLFESLKVGDILVSSWGWEQTNIDFYKVLTKKGLATVEIVPIASKPVPGTMVAHGMAENVCPAPDKEIGIPMKKRVTPYGVKLDSGQTARIYDRGDKGMYQSWYA